MNVTNTLAYYATELITTIKRFMVFAPTGRCENLLTVQGSLTERESLVQLTSLYQLVQISSYIYRKYYLPFLLN